MDNFIQRKTTLDLNGPIISWLTQPTGITTCGIGTFVGIATATFPVGLPASYATNTGSLSYQWYYKVGTASTSGLLYDGTIAGLGLTGVSGSGSTTLTVYGTSTTFELTGTTETVDGLKFFCRPDYTPSAYGTGDPITVGTARSTPNANNELDIDSNNIDFTINPSIQITTQPSTQTVGADETATFNVVGIVTGHSAETLSYQWTVNGNNASDGTTTSEVTVPVNPTNTKASGWDGGNGGSGNNIYFNATSWTGTRSIRFETRESSGIYHTIVIDGIGTFPENFGVGFKDVTGGKIYKCYPTSSPANLHIGGDTPAGGGNQRLVIEEGGDDWNDMVLDVSGDGFFTKYTEQPTISSGPTTETTSVQDITSGSQTNELKLTTGTAGIQTVNCKITHPVACNSPLYTNVVNFNVVSTRQIINYEAVAADGIWRGSGSHDINDSSIRFTASNSNLHRSLVIYAPEQDIVAKITMAGAAGGSVASNVGGEGGLSQFYLTLKKNREYMVKLGSSTPPTGGNNGGGGGTFLYNGGTLVAVCGGGGGGGSDTIPPSHGGNGGGLGLAGSNGLRNDAAPGGQRWADGTLPLQGYFPGGQWAVNLQERDPGRLSACTFGQYWTGQGYSACEDMGYVKFHDASGNVVSQSTDSIIRGYKPGLGHRNNGGHGKNNGGGGGSGASGGWGGNRGGGGGGSGYNNGDAEVITTQLGGNSSREGYIIFEV